MDLAFIKRILLLLCAFSVFSLRSLYAQTSEETLAEQLRIALQKRDPAAYLALVSSDPETQEQERAFINDLHSFPYDTVVMRVADNSPDRILLHLFFQNQKESRFEAWSIDTVSENGDVKIQQRKTRSSIVGLFHLQMNPEGIPVSNFALQRQDAIFRLKKGHLFLISTGPDLAGVVFVGEGAFEFAPRDPIERQQITLFSKKSTIQTSMEHLYLRSSPETLNRLLEPLLSIKRVANPAIYDRALEIEKLYDPDAFGVKVPLSEDLWHPRLESNEFFCEMKTPYGTLIYQHSPRSTDDVLLSLKEKKQIISYYNSTGLSIVFAAKESMKLLSYDMRVAFNPSSEYLSGVAKIKLQSQEEATSIGMKLNPNLRVSQIRSNQGPLLFFQQRETNKLQVVLNDSVMESEEVLLELHYQGRIPPDEGRAEVAPMQGPSEANVYVPPTVLYSNDYRWYPQIESDPYATMTLSISVPNGYTAITNGIQTKIEKENDRTAFSYKVERPVKYFSLLVGRFDNVFSFNSIVPIRVYYYDIDKDTAIQTANNADKILRFYSAYFGEYPYQNLTIALRPLITEGGHAPATMVILNRVYTYFNIKSRKDPMNLPDFPVFLLAHELAHQWWGQAVGWRTYRDQWLSEGFAQFAAAEFLRLEYGPEAWEELAKAFSEWVEDKTKAGPLILGSRLGHLVNDRQAYTALLYNKGAYVLNMLKLWLGPEAFTTCMMKFFQVYQFQRVGINEFQQVAQEYSTEDLEPFFRQWLFRWQTPTVSWSQKIEPEGQNSIVQLHFSQSNENFFLMRIPVEAKGKDGKVFRTLLPLSKPVEEVSFSVPFHVSSVAIDPQRENLMKITETHRK